MNIKIKQITEQEQMALITTNNLDNYLCGVDECEIEVKPIAFVVSEMYENKHSIMDEMEKYTNDHHYVGLSMTMYQFTDKRAAMQFKLRFAEYF